MNTSDQVKARKSQLANEIETAESATMRLHETIDTLIVQLQGVLRDEAPAHESKEEEPERRLCEIPNKMRGIGERIQAASNRIEDLLNRLEV